MHSNNRCYLLTPPGAGAIAVVRVVGPDAVNIASDVFRPKDSRVQAMAVPDRLSYGDFAAEGETIDDVLVSLVMDSESPAVEICSHGGVRVVERILETLNRRGARMGEASDRELQRWPVSNRIEQEALEALHRAKTSRAVRFLAWQRRHLPGYIESLAVCLEAGDVDHVPDELRTLIARYDAARVLIDGATVVVLGPPNSGKSTLFNRLSGRKAAVVSARSGTTRDWVTQEVEIEGLPINLVDTAGIHETRDELERLAIDAGRSAQTRADVRILVFDAATPDPPQLELVHAAATAPRTIVVLNKCDLGNRFPPIERLTSARAPATAIQLSAETGEGVSALIEQILRMLGHEQPLGNRPDIFTERQRKLAAAAIKQISQLRTPAALPIIRKELLDSALMTARSRAI